MRKSFWVGLVLLTSSMANLQQAWAGITTYTFTNAVWGSKQGTTVCDGIGDGWVCNKAGESYSGTYQIGVKVTAGYSGAGATSVQSFTDIRRLTINYATTTKGAGTIRIQIGSNAPIDTVVTISADKNRDLTITLPAEQTGKITMQVLCTKNSIFVNSISIRSANGISPEFTQSRFQLVTDIRQLRDSGQIIFGIADGSTQKIMGYYDENISQNNIHAIAGTYSDDRTTVNNNSDAVYTLRKADNGLGDTLYIFQDELRYEEAYLVAGGGKTKNKLTVWNNYTSSQYGQYGIWDIAISPTGESVITNQGSSLGRYLQYNASDQIFSCYADSAKFTPVCIYQEEPAIGTDRPAIAAPMVNFGEVCLRESSMSGQKTITVNAIRLTEEIRASLRHGDVFSLSTSTLDRDGDELSISYNVTGPGKWIDTLDLSTKDTSICVSVLLRATTQMSIAQAVQASDFTSIYLNPVMVTKKYDKYIFIRDETGAMLIYDSNDSQGKPYGQGLEQGDVLHGVHGRFRNYYGVPELLPIEAWTVGTQKTECLPDSGFTRIDSADVCRYIVLDSVVFQGTQCIYKGQTYATADPFHIGTIIENIPTRIEAVVSYDWDILTLWIVRQTPYPATTGISNPYADTAVIYTILGIPTDANHKGIKIQNGRKILQK